MKSEKLLGLFLGSLPQLLLFKFFICWSLSVAVWHMYRATNDFVLVELLQMNPHFAFFVGTVSKPYAWKTQCIF